MPLAWIAVFLSAGIWIASIIRVPALFSAGLAAFFLAISAAFIKKRAGASLAALFAAFLFIGCMLFGADRILPAGHISEFTPSRPEEAFIEGTVADDPSVTKTFYGEPRTDFILEAHELRRGGINARVSGKVKVSVTGSPKKRASYGDIVSLRGKLSKPRGPGNPGEFDYAKYLERHRIFSSFSANAREMKVTAGAGKRNPVVSYAYKARARISGLISENLPDGDSGDFLIAILLGLRQGLSDGLNDDFMKTGTVHLLAISGLNVGLIAFLMLLIFDMLRIPRKAGYCAAIVLLIFYAVLTGATPSVVRATVMSVAILAGLLVGRDASLWNSLGLAAVVILVCEPAALFDIGFQLSFMSVASLLYFAPLVRNLAPKARFRNYIIQGCAVSFAAWVGVAPLILAYFNIVTPIAVVSNLIAVPLSFAITAAAVPFIVFGFVLPAVGNVFAASVWFLCEALFRANSLLAKAPLGHFYLPAPPVYMIIAYYLFILAYTQRERFGIRGAKIIAAALITANVVIWANALAPASKDLRATFLDVGHGDSVFVEFPGGGNMLIDGGSGGGEDWDAGRNVVLPFLRSRGVQALDAVVLTHPDADHVGGLSAVLEGIAARNIFESGAGSGTSLYRSFDRIVSARRIPRHILKRGDSITGIAGVDITCLNPCAGRAPDRTVSANDKSVALGMRFGGRRFLFCGDIGSGLISEVFLGYPDAARSGLMMLPHHGQKLSEEAEASIEAAKPEYSVISQGRAQREWAASEKMQELMRSKGIKAYRTNEDGAVFASTDGKGLIVGNFKSSRKISR
ncbi:MAG TPA: DNA internalization-related competence protein ComEC/Rec2 [Candidatus Omnitrophota bacterium]|nr:DNA internalization-related competence protein ComEC/Rec2 [Candidatus Omnitrophota bacterium]HPN65906.1 DNA internalization-related competence protein ComEC/Rec2 [Candidatus Omnitrophota bacterium]